MSTPRIPTTYGALAPNRNTLSPSTGGGVLIVLLDLSLAEAVLDRVADQIAADAAPVTVLSGIRRPLTPAASPFCPVAPYLPEAEVVACGRARLREHARRLARRGRIDLEVAFEPLHRAVTDLLRRRDYAQLVLVRRGWPHHRWQCRRIESAARSRVAEVRVVRV